MIPNRTFDIEIKHTDYLKHLEITFYREIDSGKYQITWPEKDCWIIKEIKFGESTGNLPKFQIGTDLAKKLMIELKKYFMYEEKETIPKEIDAIKYHLEDMRKLVFNDTKKI